ncbi:uncharacterized protein LAESUDRAFT_193688 [Laetiporus sulphureus 93-53]|uniref:methylisocitrate lyase n=1 Tax=Laetiporus sulphureus 93-53 TaxID=1314785 RepID=A0A165ARC6_9APHY|nr:uncharacterized protein LAESUDRAFT_193688 [Laetiporus sulphureus 93-53]KZS99514.1 hypothetical protein LAESUDRAFT_193688 [Laetiporus sulphureus 93-53]
MIAAQRSMPGSRQFTGNARLSRLIAVRFQLNLLMHPMHLITRADAESARLISSTVGTRDHPFILVMGVTSCDKALAEAVEDAEACGDGAAEVSWIEAERLARNKLVTMKWLSGISTARRSRTTRLLKATLLLLRASPMPTCATSPRTSSASPSSGTGTVRIHCAASLRVPVQ